MRMLKGPGATVSVGLLPDTQRDVLPINRAGRKAVVLRLSDHEEQSSVWPLLAS